MNRLTTYFAGLFFVLSLVCVLIGELMLGWYLTMLGAIQWLNDHQRRRTYVDGWLQGRADMLLNLHQSENQGEFTKGMLDADVATMRVFVGDRQTKKFLDNVVKHAAASDGSHDAL
jgi:hypothetical protein